MYLTCRSATEFKLLIHDHQQILGKNVRQVLKVAPM